MVRISSYPRAGGKGEMVEPFPVETQDPTSVTTSLQWLYLEG